MSVNYNTSIVTNGLVLCLDAANSKSYPGSGTTWTDLSGNGNSGTLINSPIYNTSNNGSFTFNGSNTYVDTTFATNIVTTGFTYSFWFNANQLTVDFPAQYFINSDGNTIFRIERNSAGSNSIEFGHSQNGGLISNTELSSFNFPNNIWHYCSLVYDGNFKYIYKNGILDATSSSGQVLTYYAGAFLRIGARQGGSLLPFKGEISYVTLHNRALTASEINQNFNALRGRYGI